MREKYLKWLKDNPKDWSEATVKKYESVIRIISKDMILRGVITKVLYEMSLFELDASILMILQDEFFINKDRVGKQMYSNGLKQYRLFATTNISSYKNDLDILKFENNIMNDNSISITERETIIEARVGQGKFRRQLIEKYGKCLITGVDDSRFLIASHIKPWAHSNAYERLSVYNGLLFTPTFDKLFDSGLMTFTDGGKLLISSIIGGNNARKLHIPQNEIFDLSQEREFKINMQYHRDVLFVK